MPPIKSLINIADFFFSAAWGVIMIDILPFSIDLLNSIDGYIKVLMSLLGAVYFGFRIYFYYQHQSLDKKIKQEELKKIMRENDIEDEF